jgi:hypothetical protein
MPTLRVPAHPMTLQDVLDSYDRPGMVILLEGKREVEAEDQPRLRRLGIVLAERTRHCRFRSGNAPGADACFSAGVAGVALDRLEVITPYATHRSRQKLAGTTYAVDSLTLTPEVIVHTQAHPSTRRQLERYVAGARDRYAIKAAYVLRDTVKVLGCGEVILPAALGIFYDDLDQPRLGGTGHTMRVCDALGIPVLDQRVWMGWLD